MKRPKIYKKFIEACSQSHRTDRIIHHFTNNSPTNRITNKDLNELAAYLLFISSRDLTIEMILAWVRFGQENRTKDKKIERQETIYSEPFEHGKRPKL